MTKGRIIAAVVALVVVGAIAAGVAISAQNAVPQIDTAKVKKGTLGVIVTASGKVDPATRSDVFPPAAGTLDSVEVTDGARVEAGDVLAVMDTGPMEISANQALSGIAAADAQYAAAGAGVPTSAEYTAADANITATKTAYTQARDAYDAYKDVFDATPEPLQASMEATLGILKLAKEQAYAGYAGAKASRSALDKRADVGASRNAASAARSASEESYRIAKDQIDRATLLAPRDGVVVFNALGAPGVDGKAPTAAEGAAVAPQSAPFTVVNLGGVGFMAQVDEADVDRVKTGMMAKVTLDAFPGESLEARVITVKPAAIQTTTGGIAFPVELEISSGERELLVGMSGSVDIEVDAVSDAVIVPIEAIFDEDEKKFVYLIEKDKVSKQEVTTGALTDTEAEIATGVEPGAEVAVGNLSSLKDGMAVRVK